MNKKNFNLIYIILANILIVAGLFLSLAIILNNKNKNNKLETRIIPYIDSVDYTKMTKSQIKNRIDSLNVLSEATKEWPELIELNTQVLHEINMASNHLEANSYLYPYTEEDFILLSYMIQVEGGSNFITDEEQCLVASVIINRRDQGGVNKNLTNPTIKDIINEAGQYAICNNNYIDANSVNFKNVSDRCKENARKVLEGEFTCPKNVIFQALFTQGEIYKSFYHEALNNTTYFCYGR